jgi:type III restriction enzyme
LLESLRDDRIWHYALVGETQFYDWRQKGARLGKLLDFARVRATVSASAQGDLRFDN